MTPYSAALHVLTQRPASVHDLDRALGELIPSTRDRPSADQIVETLLSINVVKRDEHNRFYVPKVAR